jgi:hypothetical protein
MRDSGVTDFAASEFALNGDDREATRELLVSVLAG